VIVLESVGFYQDTFSQVSPFNSIALSL